MREVRPWVAALGAAMSGVALAACSLLVDTEGLSGIVLREGGDGALVPLDSGLPDSTASFDGSVRVGDSSPERDGSIVGTAKSCGEVGGQRSSDCGPQVDEDCCASLPVPGGKFFRSYDGLSNTSAASEATISTFRLDRFEVTVGRFRRFVAAVAGGWLPPSGSGKHSHLNAGKGLSQEVASLHEAGWEGAWNQDLATTQAGWTAKLSCKPGQETWTNTAGTNESRPIVCETWFEAYAFCIWDDGFLPTEAEWNYAAAGGSDQRAYPWSSAFAPPALPPPLVVDSTYANYAGGPGSTSKVGSFPRGDGRWLHADLGGNASEWTFDWYQPYPSPCQDCASFASSAYRAIRGSSFGGGSESLTASYRGVAPPSARDGRFGLRCARAP